MPLVRGRCCGRNHGGGLTDPAGVIRPALEAALVVARSAPNGAAEPPRALRPYLGFNKLPPTALRAIARAVEADEPFRRRVADAVGQEELGRPGWLWLTRPDGWEDEVAAAQAAVDEVAAEAAEAREERSTRRKLDSARQIIDRARAETAEFRDQVGRLQEELSDERSRRTAAETEVDEVKAALSAREEERDRAVRELKELEGRYARQAATLRELQEPQERPEAERPQATDLADLDEVADMVDAVVGALGGAADGIRKVAQSLDHLGDQLGAEIEARTDVGAAPGSVTDVEARSDRFPASGAPAPGPGHRKPGPAPSRRPGPSGQPAGRVPARLPGGVLDDSVEAAAHLLGLSDAVVLVDGYNVSMTGWPDEPVAEQRARLVRALDGLAARHSALYEVVFDGAEVVPSGPVPQPNPRDLHVRFSAPDEEADDLLLAMIGQFPVGQTVVVVSSDKRVRTGARRQGANVLHSRQLLDLLR